MTIDNILVTANPPPPPTEPPPVPALDNLAEPGHGSKSNIVIPAGAIVLPTITLAMVNSRNEAIEAGEICEDEPEAPNGGNNAAAGRYVVLFVYVCTLSLLCHYIAAYCALPPCLCAFICTSFESIGSQYIFLARFFV